MRATKGRKIWATSGFLFLVVALIGVLVLTACAGGGGNGGNGATPRPRPWVLKFARATTGIGGGLGIDPGTSSEGTSPGLQADWLTSWEWDGEAFQRVPVIATSWEFNRDTMTTDHWIRTDVPFHNGDFVTAEDIKFSMDRYFDPDVVGPEWAAINDRFVNRVEIVAPDHIRTYWDEWNWAYVLSNSGVPLVPKDYIEGLIADLGNLEGWTEWAEQPVTTGAFKVADWERDSYVHLVKAFDEHFYHGVPPFDEVYVYVVVEPSTRLAMLKAGEVDIANIPPAMVSDVENDPNLTLAWSRYSSPWCVRFYDVFLGGMGPLTKDKVRQAIKLAIDREGIGEYVFHGALEPWGSFYPPYHIAYREREPDPYDPEEAQRLLEEAGYLDGFDIVFSYPLDREAESQALVASLADVGIRAEATGIEPTTWATMLWTNQHIGMGYIHQPWWGGSSVFDIGQFVNDWGAQGTRDSPEIEAAWEAQNAATTEEEYILTCQAAEDVLFDLDCQMVVWAVHGAYGYTNDTIESWEPTMGSELDQNLFRVTLKKYM